MAVPGAGGRGGTRRSERSGVLLPGMPLRWKRACCPEGFAQSEPAPMVGVRCLFGV